MFSLWRRTHFHPQVGPSPWQGENPSRRWCAVAPSNGHSFLGVAITLPSSSRTQKSWPSIGRPFPRRQFFLLFFLPKWHFYCFTTTTRFLLTTWWHVGRVLFIRSLALPRWDIRKIVPNTDTRHKAAKLVSLHKLVLSSVFSFSTSPS